MKSTTWGGWAVMALAIPGLAQTPPEAARVTLDPTHAFDARLFAATAAATALPANVEIPPSFAGFVQDIWIRSATFRAQCTRLAQARGWSVRLFVSGQPIGGARARTTFAHHGQRHQAEIRLFFADHTRVELLAHELEHVLEQVDGVDLARLERLGARGVFSTNTGLFETDRAVEAGRRVAREFDGRGGTGS